jgi:hypothetical protein
LIVDPGARGLGIGKDWSMVHALRSAGGLSEITLWITVSGSGAEDLSKSRIQTGEEEKHHSFGHDLFGRKQELDLKHHLDEGRKSW